MSSAPRYIPRYTVEDYQKWQGDWELADGIAISMAPSPFGRHQRCSLRLARLLLDSIERTGCQADVLIETDWIISSDTILRPDISVVCGNPVEGHITSSPAIVAEVLSASTRERDRSYKFDLYRKAGVVFYFLVDPENESVEAFCLTDTGEYESFETQGTIELKICDTCRIAFDLTAVFVGKASE